MSYDPRLQSDMGHPPPPPPITSPTHQQQTGLPPYPGAYPAADYQNFSDPRLFQPSQLNTNLPTDHGSSFHFQPLASPPPPSSNQQRAQHGYDPSSAVNNAFNKSSAASEVSPDLIHKITQQVIDSLKANGISAPQPPAGTTQSQTLPYPQPGNLEQSYSFPPQQQQQQAPPSHAVPQPSDYHSPPPPQTAFNSPPPQPYGARPSTTSSAASVPPPPPASAPSPPPPKVDRHDYASGSASPSHASKESPPRYSTRDDMEGRQGERGRSSPQDGYPNGIKEDLTGRYGERERSVPGYDGANGRPPKPSRSLTSEEETALERAWQPLFAADGQPTSRLGMFLRGLAMHLIEDYEPKFSLVITPSKMRRFYEEVRVPSETYPWREVFGLSDTRLCKIYRDLKCEHHFVQDPDNHETPHIPALTPRGFESFMTGLIQAHPDAEFDRLAKAVLDMPISNADDRKERFPKQISRRLFPKIEDSRIRQRYLSALNAEGAISLPKSTTAYFPPPPPPKNPPSPQMTNSGLERERAPYSHANHIPASRSASESDDQEFERDTTPLALPIERERKPYTAGEGTGKFYAEGSTSNLRRNASKRDHRLSDSSISSSGYIPPPPPPTNRPYRAGSNATRTTGPPSNPTSIPRRPRSPSFSADHPNTTYYSRSENAVSDIPQAQYSSNLYSDPDEAVFDERLSDNGLRRENTRDRDYRREHERRHSRTAEWAKRYESGGNGGVGLGGGGFGGEDTGYQRETAEDYYRRYGKLPPPSGRNYA